MKPEELIEKAKRCFRQASDAEEKQRQREKDDLRFQVPEYQWDETARRQRQGLAADGVPTPARPILSIPKLDQPIQLVLNQERAARPGVNIHPLSPDADDEVAEILQGLYRQIERNSQAATARSWAFDRATKCGRGVYRVNTRYDEEGGHPFDQVITIERILDQAAVYFDPSAQKSDFSDGEWALVTSWLPIERFRALYPKASLSTANQDFEDMATDAPEWVRGEGEEQAILVAEYFYKVHEDVCICLMADGNYHRKEDVLEPAEIVQERQRDDVKVQWCKLTAMEVLEEQEWNGRYIPLIPVIGRELQPFDSERRFVGVIGPAKDAQRLYNYAASSAVELAALEPRAPWIIAEGQDEGWESEWQQSNTRNLPALHYKPTTLSGQPVAPPTRVQVDVSRLGPSMALLQEADNFIQVTTAMYDPSLGRLNQKERSGRAIRALQDQGDMGNSHYLHNLADISLNLEARVVLDLIPAIYDRPGRIARTLDGEDGSEAVILNHPFMTHPQTKRPMALQLDASGQPIMPRMEQGEAQPKVKHYDLRKGIYSVSISIGKSYQTRLQQGAEEIGEILASRPELMPIIGPLYFKYRDFPGAREIGELLLKVRDKQFPDLLGDEEGGSNPQQDKAHIQQLEQQLQVMQQQLQAAAQEIQTQQARQQATLAKAEMDNQTKLQIAQSEQQNRLLLKTMEEKFDATIKALEHAYEQKQTKDAAAHAMAKSATEYALEKADLGFTGPNEVPLGEEGQI